MKKLPAIQFYPADWRKDPAVQSLSYHDRGIWFEILCLMHESDQRGKLLLNGKPMPNDALARLLGLDKQILTKTITTLIDYGVASRDDQGALMNRRMVNDEKLRQIRTEAGKKGGNPQLVNSGQNKRLQILVNQNSTPSSSSSTSITKKELSSESSKKKAQRLSGDFALTPQMRLWASEMKIPPEIDLILETEKFRNHYKAQNGDKGESLDWISVWKNWVLREKQFLEREKRNGKNQKSSGKTRRTDQDVFRESAAFYEDWQANGQPNLDD